MLHARDRNRPGMPTAEVPTYLTWALDQNKKDVRPQRAKLDQSWEERILRIKQALDYADAGPKHVKHGARAARR